MSVLALALALVLVLILMLLPAQLMRALVLVSTWQPVLDLADVPVSWPSPVPVLMLVSVPVMVAGPVLIPMPMLMPTCRPCLPSIRASRACP